jgi:hypothetical protein
VDWAEFGEIIDYRFLIKQPDRKQFNIIHSGHYQAARGNIPELWFEKSSACRLWDV